MHFKERSRASRWCCTSLLLVFTSCGGSGVDPEPTEYTLELSQSTLSLHALDSATIVATLKDQNGTSVTRPVAWSSDKVSVATVSDGVVTGVNPGVAYILATSEGRAASVQVNVSYAPVASLEFNPKTANLKVGQTVTIQTTARDTAGNVQPDRIVTTWSTNNSNVASVSRGVVTAVGLGTARIVGYLTPTAIDSTTVTVVP